MCLTLNLNRRRNMRAIFARFARSYTTMDLRTAEETRKVRCEKYARKHKTCGKKAVFA